MTQLGALQAVQDSLQAGEISSEQADAARERYAAIHRHFVQAMAKEKQLLDEAKQLNEELLVSNKATHTEVVHLGHESTALLACPHAPFCPVLPSCFTKPFPLSPFKFISALDASQSFDSYI